MSRAGLVSQVASVCREPGWPGCHVIAKLIFIAFNKRAEFPANQALSYIRCLPISYISDTISINYYNLYMLIRAISIKWQKELGICTNWFCYDLRLAELSN